MRASAPSKPPVASSESASARPIDASSVHWPRLSPKLFTSPPGYEFVAATQRRPFSWPPSQHWENSSGAPTASPTHMPTTQPSARSAVATPAAAASASASAAAPSAARSGALRPSTSS